MNDSGSTHPPRNGLHRAFYIGHFKEHLALLEPHFQSDYEQTLFSNRFKAASVALDVIGENVLRPKKGVEVFDYG